ncbi:protein PRRC1-B [Drosophila nasuta]|uniref:protein PRRC1-B n=1 Tax=Drosophila nasuta TaxID=42062 RepID=UPI00295F1B8E|nr:protein PRRC1-B [Drosophila nasuta]XP_060656619.1 protein PRRC1-B [Drosophila nasuta]
MSHNRLALELPRLLLLLLLTLQSLIATEALGYHYDRPTRPAPTSVYTGHHFAPLPTVQPLPPVPALPALPTARVPLPRSRPAGHIVSQYGPPPSVAPSPASSIVSTYLPPAYASPIASISYHGVAPPAAPPSAPQQLLQQPIHVPSGPAATAPPLRIPYGKQALISPGESYVANGRQLKQYAVIEIIDNDIDESPAPFLSSSFFDRYRAHVGASGTGATATAGTGLQLDSRANALVLEQQALSVQPRFQNQGQNDAIALGSGGLGYIRLPNGNVYLGSGSLGYISGQQRVASVLDARTRSESTSDALHFGHGPLGGADNFLRFK